MKPVLLLHSNPYGSKERKKLIYGDRTEQNKRLAVYKRLPLHLFNTSGRFHLGMGFSCSAKAVEPVRSPRDVKLLNEGRLTPSK